MNKPIKFPEELLARTARETAPAERAASPRRRISPITAGCIVIAVFVVGMLLWAGVASISGAVLAPGAVRVQANRKTVKHLEGGIVRTINVREGDRVQRGQVLMTFDQVQPKAQLEVFRSQFDGALAQRARFQAELGRRPSITFPPELLRRASDPRVAQLMQEQQALFESRNQLESSQVSVLQQRVEQLNTTITGLRAQIEAVTSQSALIKEELAGMQSLYEQGYAPKTRILALQRTAAGLGGRRGELVANIAKAQEGIGEARIQMAGVVEKRQTEAAEGLTKAQEEIAELLPRLRVAEQAMTNTVVRPPVDGYVLNLTQFTEGGVVQAGEPLLDVVPLGTPLVIQARVSPKDTDEIAVGMKARVQLTAYSSRVAPPLDAEVVTVSADRLTDERTGESFFEVQLTVKPDQIKRLGKGAKLAPGMPANVMILTRPRTVLDYFLSPIRDTFNTAMREQ